MDEQVVQPVVEALPPLAMVVLGGLVGVGVVLWLFGRKIAPVACGVCGLVLGGIGGFVIGQKLAGQGAYTMPLVIGGGIAGGLLSTMLFRVWMGVSAAVLLALAMPAAVIVWQGTPAPAVDFEAVGEEVRGGMGEVGAEEVRETAKPQARERDARRSRGSAKPQAAKEAEAEGGTWIPRWMGALWGVAVRVYETQAEAVRGWWDGLGPAGHGLIMLAALAGLFAGLVLGLAAPYWAAMVQTALVGSILIFLPLRELVIRFTPDTESLFPATPRPTLVMLGLITVVGVLLQWALFGRSTDK